MEHYNRYLQTRFNKIDEDWRQNPNREKDEMYRDNRKYYREQYHDPNHPSYPVPYAKNFVKEQEIAERRYGNYNDPAYYKIKKKEFGHGPGRNMNPGSQKITGKAGFMARLIHPISDWIMSKMSVIAKIIIGLIPGRI